VAACFFSCLVLRGRPFQRSMAENQERSAPPTGRRRKKKQPQELAWEWCLSLEDRAFLVTPNLNEDLEQLRHELVLKRWRAVWAAGVQGLVAALCIFSYVGRPSRMVLSVSALQMFLAMLGLRGAMMLRGCIVAVHLMLMSGMTGAYLLANAVQALFVKDSMLYGSVLSAMSLVILLCLIFNMHLGMALLEYHHALAAQMSSDESGSEEDEVDVEAACARAAPLSLEPRCCICMDRLKDGVITPCGHKCICTLCGERLMARGVGCPVCRRPIVSVVRVYES